MATSGPPRAEKLIFSDKTLACSNDCAPKPIYHTIFTPWRICCWWKKWKLEEPTVRPEEGELSGWEGRRGSGRRVAGIFFWKEAFLLIKISFQCSRRVLRRRCVYCRINQRIQFTWPHVTLWFVSVAGRDRRPLKKLQKNSWESRRWGSSLNHLKPLGKAKNFYFNNSLSVYSLGRHAFWV